MRDYSEIKIGYYDSTIIVRNEILWGLIELGFQVERSEVRVHLNEICDREMELLKAELDNFDYVITQNFSIELAEACYLKGKKYISWVYDSPQTSLYTKQALYPTNYIFAFDKIQVKRIKDIGCDRIFYQPLAANMLLTSMLDITDDDIKKFATDVSFVGQIYDQDFYRDLMESIPQSVVSEFNDMYKDINCNWHKGINPIGYLSDNAIKSLEVFLDKSFKDDYKIDERFLCELLIVIPSFSGEERLRVLNKCGSLFNTVLYTGADSSRAGELSGVSVRPPVDHDTDMYKVFYSSKINLNISLRSIESGIPQRVFDIMSVGGTVFTNYQEEVMELFVPDKDIVVFHDMDELADKAKYYLSHEEERVKIGINGYYRVRDEYNYVKSIEKMFAIVEG